MNKKDLIVQSAIELFQEQGIEKTTVSHIVKRAQIAQGTFYLYFPSKLSLMPAIAEEMVKVIVKQVKENVTKASSFEAQIKEVVDTIFSINESYSELLALIYAGLASTEHLKEWETVYAPIYEYISQLLDEAKEKRQIDEQIDSHRTAKLMIGLIESAAEQVFLFDYRDEKEIIYQKEAVMQFVLTALSVT